MRTDLPETDRRAAVACALFLLLAAGCRDATGVDAERNAAPGSLRVRPNHTPAPASVTLTASFQSETGCSGDWQPDCVQSHLTYDVEDGVWQGTWTIPASASAYEYKVALNDDWAENYGRYAYQNGQNIALSLATSASVKFYYDHKTHWITDDRNSVIATAVGSFQSELGCTGDWKPDCLRSWLQDSDEDGVYSFFTNSIPAGNWEVKVAIGESWAENYGQGGTLGGANIPFTVAVDGTWVLFQFNASTKVATVVVFSLAQSISFTSPAPSQAYVGDTYAVSATATSGLAVTFSSLTPTTCSVSGSTVTFVGVGTCTVAADQPGDANYLPALQQTQTVQVSGWQFTGFLAPVENAPALNGATAGATVPVKFSLGGDLGLDIFAAGSPSSAGFTCPTAAAAAPAVIAVAGTGRKSTLTYDAATGVYTYFWVTNKAWANSCRALTVVLADGTTREAYFRFR